MKTAILLLALLLLINAGCRSTPPVAVAEPKLLELSGELRVHDPAIIKAQGTYYIFCTGGGGWWGGVIPIHCSTNLHDWKRCGFVLDDLPAWATNAIPLARGAWAPDISWFAGKYHVYYALSSFGVNNSAIGLAVNETLDQTSTNYNWVDEGMVVRSRRHRDDFNAIDPNIVIEDAQNVWLCWGSFWGGIKMRRIEPATGMLSTTDTNLYTLAERPRTHEPVTPPVEGAVEAPTIVKRGDYWYLFASYDFCCRGTNSTYCVKVGRSRKVTGPYVDRTGKKLTDYGGTIVVQPITPLWNGAGHEAVLQDDDGQDYLIFHSYDKETGISRLEISTMVWEKGWPRVANGE